jgi:hypothetical protein
MPIACGEHRGDAGAGDAVQAFVPPIILGHAQPRYGGRGVAQLVRFFLQRHPRDYVACALLGRRRGIAELAGDGLRTCRRQPCA